jgi:hypothetical protein
MYFHRKSNELIFLDKGRATFWAIFTKSIRSPWFQLHFQLSKPCVVNIITSNDVTALLAAKQIHQLTSNNYLPQIGQLYALVSVLQ